MAKQFSSGKGKTEEYSSGFTAGLREDWTQKMPGSRKGWSERPVKAEPSGWCSDEEEETRAMPQMTKCKTFPVGPTPTYVPAMHQVRGMPLFSNSKDFRIDIED